MNVRNAPSVETWGVFCLQKIDSMLYLNKYSMNKRSN